MIFIAFRSFQALLDRTSQRQCLESCAVHLSPQGKLAINVFYPKWSLLTAPEPLAVPAEEYSSATGEKIKETGYVRYDRFNQLVFWEPRYESMAPDGKTTVREGKVNLRYFFRYEMEWMLEACGFEVEASYGNFDRSPLQADSPEMIFVAKKG